MFQRTMHFSERSSLEVASRIFNNEEKIMITLTGPKNQNEFTASSVIITDEHLALLITHLQEALNREKSWPVREGE